MEDRIGPASQLFPVGVSCSGRLGRHQSLPGQSARIVAGLAIAGLAALALLDHHRDDDGLHVVGIHLQQAACGAERLVGIADLLIGVDEQIEHCLLDHALRIGCQKILKGRCLELEVSLGDGHLIGVKLGRIFDRDGVRILGFQRGRGNEADARSSQHGCKDKLLHSVLLGITEIEINIQALAQEKHNRSF